MRNNAMTETSGPQRSASAGLAKTWPSGVEAVKGIDFDVAPGEVFGLLGPNGAGKSTTVGMLTTTVLPTAGTAQPARSRRRGRSDRGPSRQRGGVPGRGRRPRARPAAATSRSTPGSGAVPRPIAARRIDEQTPRLRPRRHHRPSGRHLQRRPAPPARDRAGAPVRSRRCCSSTSRPSGSTLASATSCSTSSPRCATRSGTTVLLTTHYLDEAERLCDRVGIMHAGARRRPRHSRAACSPSSAPR